MDKRLEEEILTIINRYNVHMEQECLHSTYCYSPIKDIDEFEERMNWTWLWDNFHPSHELVCEFPHKFDMEVIFDSVMTKEEFKYYMEKREKENGPINSRLEILDFS